MKKDVIFGISIALILIAIFAILFFTIEGAPVIKVKANVTINPDGKPVIKIIDAEQDEVHPLKAPRGHSTESFPSVDAIAFLNLRMSCYWASKKYHGAGTYDFVIGFLRGVKPKKGDMIRVYVKVCDAGGNTLTSDYKDIIWE
ncbi:MAG: hypothetical protein ACXQTS_07430 [Candidatus Methanospirareceae archaeon]